ncbi:MAG: efflux RND transporter periplasmic adaptor subunit [Cyanobacteria bacterium P01_H01_bin.121]
MDRTLVLRATVLSVLILIGACQKPKSGSEATTQSAAAPSALPVSVTTLKTATLKESSDFVGTLEAIAKSDVKAETQGRIQAIPVKPGQYVEAGTVLVVLEPEQAAPDLAGAQAAVTAARATRDTAVQQLKQAQAQQDTAQSNLELAQGNFNRDQYLAEQGAIAQEKLDQTQNALTSAQNALTSAKDAVQAAQAGVTQADAQIQQAQAQADSSTVTAQLKNITAPIAGYLGDITLQIGDFVTSDQAIVTVANLNAFDLRIPIPAGRTSDLRLGLPVELLTPGTDKQLAMGAINFISPTVNTENQTILIKARFANTDQVLRDGESVEAQVIWQEKPGVLIPTTAVRNVAEQDFVFLVTTQAPADPASSAADQQASSNQASSNQASSNQASSTANQTEADPAQPQTIVTEQSVDLGPLQGDSYQVEGGLKAGDQIAISGVSQLQNGMPVQPIPQQ